jgi:hypothetical protein
MPIDPSQTATQSIQEPPASPQPPVPKTAKDQTQDSLFGPAYVLDPSLKSAVSPGAAGTVPFVGPSAGQTLAALPPLKSLGAAGLTELSLQHLLDPSGGTAGSTRR